MENKSNPEKRKDNHQLRLENEILQLKLKAEHDAVIHISKTCTPEMENDLLNAVQHFHAVQNSRQITIYDLLRQPSYLNASLLNNQAIQDLIPKLLSLLSAHQIELHFMGEYDSRTIYRFITEELFQQLVPDRKIPGFITSYTYEDFHPNHELELKQRTNEFMDSWINRKFCEHSWELGDVFIHPEGRTIPKKYVIDKLRFHFKSYVRLHYAECTVSEVRFHLNEQEPPGLGHTAGYISYEAVPHEGKPVRFEGPFKLYFSLENNCWQIYYFVFPGFRWE